MLYRFRRAIHRRKFDRAIAGILKTTPLQLKDAPWCVVSMVANHDVLMYLTAIKSFYPKIGGGKVVAIIDRDAPETLRSTLTDHLPGIEFVILEDIPTGSCQRGGTWERLLYCLDRSQTEYTIQMDSDTLATGDSLIEVVDCIRANRAFTMADGFIRMTLPEAAELAQATPSNFIGIVTEAAFDRYPGGGSLHYIRGSSGFAGFAKGGYTRAQISIFHEEMERLVGKTRWREWGTEQCGSNFAVANSPNPLVLPYPEYGSFDRRNVRSVVKLYHFIGTVRYNEGYFARRSQEVIAKFTPGAPPVFPSVTNSQEGFFDRLPLRFTRNLSRGSILNYLIWHLNGRSTSVTVGMRARREFRDDPAPGPRFYLRRKDAGNTDLRIAYEVFIRSMLLPPVWIPPERVKLVVDLGANVGMSCLWWLANYWRTRVVAFEPDASHFAAASTNIALNGYGRRIDLYQAIVDPKAAAKFPDEESDAKPSNSLEGGASLSTLNLFEILAGRRVDILKIDIGGSEVGLLDDFRFGGLDIGAIVMQWHPKDPTGRGGRDWCTDRLESFGFRTYLTFETGGCGMVWGYRDYNSTGVA